MKRTLTTLIILACAWTAAPAAQTADHKAVQDAVAAFLLHLGDHEFDKVATDLSAKSIIIVVRERPASGAGQAEWTNSYQTGESWVETLKKNPNPTTFREPLTNVSVTIDSGRLAYVRADFQTVRDGKVGSSGVDQFTLTLENGAWKIAAIAYTSLPVK
ncbi:MAG TPA: hypothetical protein VGJ29_14135 [Vicinamibacterales bacterium]|jgi:hypothetical protein